MVETGFKPVSTSSLDQSCRLRRERSVERLNRNVLVQASSQNQR